jgi:hypothetical protein
MLGKSTPDIRSDAGIERLVSAFDDIDEIHVVIVPRQNQKYDVTKAPAPKSTT